jgi:hypothetical protein
MNELTDQAIRADATRIHVSILVLETENAQTPSHSTSLLQALGAGMHRQPASPASRVWTHVLGLRQLR